MQFVLAQVNFRPGECRIFCPANWAAYDASGNNQLGGAWNDPLNTGYYFDTESEFSLTEPAPAIGLLQAEPTASGPTATLGLGTLSSNVALQTKAIGTNLPEGYNPQDRPEAPVANSSTDPPDPILYPEMVAHGWCVSPANSGTGSWNAIDHIGGSAAPVPFNEWINPVVDPEDNTRYQTYTGFSWRPTEGGQTSNILFDLPRQDSPILSLGRLNQVQVEQDPDNPAWLPHDFFDAFPAMQQPWSDGDSLWDRYFFSGVPITLTSDDTSNPGYNLPDGRLRFLRLGGSSPPLDDLRFTENGSDPINRSSAHLLVDGAFNVNSTSVEAWKAVLASYAGVPVAYVDGSLSVELESDGSIVNPIAFPLARSYMGPTTNPDDSAEPSVWRGYRRVSDSQLQTLAQEIRDQVAARGTPFHSMAEFVNSGILQAAIDTAGLNAKLTNVPQSSPTTAAASVPGMLTQAGLLTALGPILTVRSDTFLIRAYGESVNPTLVNADGSIPQKAIESRAWCEAVVQRVPDYVDYSVDSTGNLTSGNYPWDEPTGINARFGRRFKIVQFRWLSPSDI